MSALLTVRLNFTRGVYVPRVPRDHIRAEHKLITNIALTSQCLITGLRLTITVFFNVHPIHGACMGAVTVSGQTNAIKKKLSHLIPMKMLRGFDSTTSRVSGVARNIFRAEERGDSTVKKIIKS